MTDTVHLDPAVRELPLDATGLVEIQMTSSGLRIRGTEYDKVVIRTRNGEPLEGEVEIDAAQDRVVIRDGSAGELRFGPFRVRAHSSADLDLDVPRSARLIIRTLSGDIDGTGIRGESRWSTASGDVRLKVEGGPVSADSMSGDLGIESDVPIAVTLRSVSGDVHIRAPRIEALRAETTSGDVRLEAALAERGVHSVSSVSGDVELSTGSPVRLEAQTISGDIRAAQPHRADGGRGRRVIVVGTGSVPISVRTTSGDVRLRSGPTAAGIPEAPAAALAPTAPTAAAAPVPPTGPLAPGAPEVPAPVAPDAPELPDTGEIAGTPFAASGGTEGVTDRREAERLVVLRALERGDLDVEAASRRLEALEDAGPRSFRGWC